MSDFLAEASAFARQDIASANAEPEPTSTDTPAAPTPEPVAEAHPSTPVAEPAAATPAPVPEEPTPAAQAAEQQAREFALKYKGQQLVLPEDQVIEFAQKGYDYTQKMQAIAQQQAQIQAARDEAERIRLAAIQERNELQAVLADKGKLRQLLEWTAENVTDPASDEPLTPAQAEQMVKSTVAQYLAQFEQAQKAEIARTQFEMETNRAETEFKAAFNTHVAGLLEQYPILKEVEGVTERLREAGKTYFEARLGAEGPLAKVDQKDIFQQITKEAGRRAKAEQARIDNHLKAHLVQQHAAAAKGIEPPGGTPPTPVPAKPFKLGSKELHAQAIADLQASRRDG